MLEYYYFSIVIAIDFDEDLSIHFQSLKNTGIKDVKRFTRNKNIKT